MSETGRYVYIYYLYKVYEGKNWIFYICFQITCSRWVIICVFHTCNVCACLHAHMHAHTPTHISTLGAIDLIISWNVESWSDMSNEDDPPCQFSHWSSAVESWSDMSNEDDPPYQFSHWSSAVESWSDTRPAALVNSNSRNEVNVPHLKEAGNFTDFLICYIPALTVTLHLQTLAAPHRGEMWSPYAQKYLHYYLSPLYVVAHLYH